MSTGAGSFGCHKKGTNSLKKGKHFIDFLEKVISTYKILHPFWCWEPWVDTTLDGDLAWPWHAAQVLSKVTFVGFQRFYKIFFFFKNCGRKAFLYEMLLHFKMKAKIGQWHYCCCQVGAASRLSYYHQLAGFIFCEGVCVAQHSPGGQGICSTQHSTCLLSSVVAWIINSSKYNSLPVRITASSLVYLNEKQRVQKRILARGFQSCCWEIKVTYSSAAKLEGFHMLASCLFFSSVKKKWEVKQM